ncbi:MAG: 50S ribosomal protein L25/general stress protein Ctc [Pseudomonadota bacterium]
MSDNIEFVVEVRERIGKGGAREARRNGLIPGVLYGGSLGPVPITLQQNAVVKAINTGKFIAQTVTINHKGETQLVIPQDIQFHPVTDQPEHVDLYRVEADQKIKVEVPVHFVGEAVSPGLKKGGTLNVVRHAVELLVAAGSIPDALEADVSALEIGDNVKISDIALPGDAEPTITDRDFTIATIAGRGGKVDQEDEAVDAEVEGEEVEGEEADGEEES